MPRQRKERVDEATGKPTEDTRVPVRLNKRDVNASSEGWIDYPDGPPHVDEPQDRPISKEELRRECELVLNLPPGDLDPKKVARRAARAQAYMDRQMAKFCEGEGKK